MVAIPQEYADLFEQPVIFNLATVMPNGQPQLTPVWGDLHNGELRVNTAAGRQKHKNMADRPQATVMLFDPKNPYRYVEVRGKVSRIEEEGAVDHIHAMAKKYMGADTFGGLDPNDTRIICYITPERVIGHG